MEGSARLIGFSMDLLSQVDSDVLKSQLFIMHTSYLGSIFGGGLSL